MRIFDLDQHISIQSAKTVGKISAPLFDTFGIKHFRYLKLYRSGNRIVLSNFPDYIRYIYEYGNYSKLWFDGNFPDFVKSGWHQRHTALVMDQRKNSQQIDDELSSILNTDYGTTFIQENKTYFEAYTFDSTIADIYYIDQKILYRFIYFFKQQAQKYLKATEENLLYFPVIKHAHSKKESDQVEQFLQQTQTNRYYLGEAFSDAYLTEKEMICAQWLFLGKSAEEIGIIENNATKTVQRHIENIKEKLNCHKQTEMIQILRDLNLLG